MIALLIIGGLVALGVGAIIWHDRSTTIAVTCPMCGTLNRFNRRWIAKQAGAGALVKLLASQPHPCQDHKTEHAGTRYEKTIDRGCGSNLAGLWMKHSFVVTQIKAAEKLKTDLADGVAELHRSLADHPSNIELSKELKQIERKIRERS